MQTKSRIEDVAHAAGVSTATVSRALSQPDRVSEKTRQLVRDAVEKLGYVPNAAGRALASGRTQTIGCVIPTLDLAIFARSTHAMQLVLADAGYQLLVASHNYDHVAELELIKTMQHRGVDALVLVGAQHHAQAWSSLKTWSKPVLLTWVCDERLPSVGFDNQAIAAMATRHLLELGHRKIGMISGYTQHNDRAGQRRLGFLSELEREGLSASAAAVSEQALSIQGGRLGLKALKQRHPGLTALVCGNDMVAIGAILEAQASGLRVPEDISICGIDNHELAGEIKPGLTTVSLPTQDLGRIAATQILQILAGEPVAHQSLLPFHLVQRGSTSQPAAKSSKR
ncbi:LacI family DNA-binding transcriptional regulator [Variovorax sp. PCZ-1]|uniref:LacI family DNA-binding transcriptional regulator n=1 Tax=Variovorax sp. PCZ-1 TaxID=2835533 RepID=UPI001BCF290C|nr:LacI family DNA-binding transcriptional regulator [Variovorax sp. PCZ-1]MBS7806722.1 LacI family DNA-binding transcriptional regulator [Variovorax sp. PCZ-1]